VHGTSSHAKLQLYGPFLLVTDAGVPIPITSRKSQAIIAILARTPGGTRSRAWLIDRLWSRHAHDAALNGMRRELSGL
jgi:hypothetical protein